MITIHADRTISANGRPIRTPLELFELHVQRGPGCWEWGGYRNKGGYGFIRGSAKVVPGMLAHRLSWLVHRGQIPSGMHVLHKCDNRCCVRPDHLFLGTNLDNIRDRMKKGRRGGRAPRISAQTINRIHQLVAEGTAQRKIAAETGVSSTFVFKLTHGHFKSYGRTEA